MPESRPATVADLIGILRTVPQDDLVVLPADPEGNEHHPLGPVDPSPYWYLPDQQQISSTPVPGGVRCRVLWPAHYPAGTLPQVSTAAEDVSEQTPTSSQEVFLELDHGPNHPGPELLHAMRLEKTRRVVAALGLAVERTTSDAAACDQCSCGGADELAPLLGVALGVIDSFVEQDLMVIASAYHDTIRSRAGSAGIVEREMAWWHALHHRAALLVSLSAIPRPPDAAPASEAVAAADELLRATAKLVHAVTTIRFMLETPPDSIPGGPRRQYEVMSAAVLNFIDGHEMLQHPFETLLEGINPGGV